MVDFDPCCLFSSVVIISDDQLSRNVLLFSCNPIGQLCLGVPCYSRHTEGSLYLVNSTKKVREREFRNVSKHSEALG